MRDAASPGVIRAMQAIRRYLCLHPAAADSARGVAQWWLPAMGIQVSDEEVGMALLRLCEEGEIGCTPLPGGDAIYWSTPPPAH